MGYIESGDFINSNSKENSCDFSKTRVIQFLQLGGALVHIIMNSSVHIERLLFKICSFNFADIHCLIIYKVKRSDVCISCPIIKGFLFCSP